MRMEQLRCLVDIAQTKSISATAQNLYMTHQAVSQRIKQLEADLGVEVLVRTNTGVRITEIGEQIVAYAQQILSVEKNIEQLCEAQKMFFIKDDIVIHVISSSPVLNLVLTDISVVFAPLPYKIIFKIDLVDSIEAVLEGVTNNQYHIGLATYNTEALGSISESFTNACRIELLEYDYIVAVTKRKFCKNSQDYFPLEVCRDHCKTSYNIIPIAEQQAAACKVMLSQSFDCEYHRRMIERKNAVVLMPRLAYYYSFYGKKYIGLPLQQVKQMFSHVALYQKDAHERIDELIAMIRRELQLAK